MRREKKYFILNENDRQSIKIITECELKKKFFCMQIKTILTYFWDVLKVEFFSVDCGLSGKPEDYYISILHIFFKRFQ